MSAEEGGVDDGVAGRAQLRDKRIAVAGPRIQRVGHGKVARRGAPCDVDAAFGIDCDSGRRIGPAPPEISGIDKRRAVGGQLGHKGVPRVRSPSAEGLDAADQGKIR